MIQLNEQQGKVIAAGLTLSFGLLTLFILGGALWFIGSCLAYFSGVLVPLALALVMALMLKPVYNAVLRRLKHPLAALAVVYLAVLVPLALFAGLFGKLAFDQMAALVREAPHWIEALLRRARPLWPVVQGFLEQHGDSLNVQQMLEDYPDAAARMAALLTRKTLAAVSGMFGAVAGVLGMAIVPVYLAFFLMARTPPVGRVEGMLPFLKPDTRKDVIYLVNEFFTILVSFFRGQVIIALLQGVLYASGFVLVGLNYGLVLGLLLGFLNIVPYLGSMVGLAVTLPLAYFQDDGGLSLLLMTLAVIAVVQVIEGYVLTPRIMGQRTGLHPVVIMVAIFFWGTALDGLAGMILAIPLTAFFVVFWRLAKAKYIREWI